MRNIKSKLPIIMSGMAKKFSENAGYFKTVVVLCCTEKIHAKGAGVNLNKSECQIACSHPENPNGFSKGKMKKWQNEDRTATA